VLSPAHEQNADSCAAITPPATQEVIGYTVAATLEHLQWPEGGDGGRGRR